MKAPRPTRKENMKRKIDIIEIMYSIIFSDGSGSIPESLVLGIITMRKWVYGKLNKAFLHLFCQIFGIFDYFSKWKVLKYKGAAVEL